MARLKVHHPREFYAACLNHHKSMYPARVFVWDALRHGVPIHAPDVFLSQANWTPELHGVRAGLGLIRGLGHPTVAALLAERQRQPFRNLADLVRRIPFRKGEAERLILVGACRQWGPRADLLAELRELSQSGRQLSLLPANVHHLPSLLHTQLTLTGIPFCMHPAELIHDHGFCLAGDMVRHLDGTVTMIGILDAVKYLRTQPRAGGKAEDMSFVTLEDASGMYDAILFPDSHAKFARLFTHIGPFRLRGRVIEQWETLSLELIDASPLPLPA
jgi:DNA polymerase III alpha subunit